MIVARAVAFLLAVALGLCPSFVVAQGPAGYPSQPLRIVLPYPPGGTTDFFARLVGTRLSSLLGQPVIVENRPGGDGIVAAVAVAKSLPADGYSILLGDRGMYALNVGLRTDLPYDPAVDLVPVAKIATIDYTLVVNPEALPVRNVGELLAAAKASGTGLNCAIAGTSTATLAMHLFVHATRASLVPVAYKGANPALQDLLAGRVGMMFLDRNAATPHVKSGKLRLVAVTGPKRAPAFPDVPTVAESGVKGYDIDAWYGFTMRAGTPPSAVQAIHAAYSKVIADPDLQQKLADVGIAPVVTSPGEFAAFMRAEQELWRTIIRERNIKVN